MARSKRTIILTDQALRTIDTSGRSETIWWHGSEPILGLRVRANGSRTWVLQASERTSSGGKRRPKTLAPLDRYPTVRAAVRAAEERRRGDALTSSVTVTEAVRRLLLDRSPHWKPGTVRQMKTALRKVVDAFGEVPLGELRAGRVAVWFDAMQDRPHAADYALTALSITYRHAAQLGQVPPHANPCRGLALRRKAPYIAVLDASGYRRLTEALDRLQYDPAVGMTACEAVRLIATTGARRSEIQRLRWSECDGDVLRLSDGKSGPRNIYLSEPAAEVLYRQRCRKHPWDERAWVFAGYNATVPEPVSARQWDAIRCAIGRPAMRMHDLRHSYASLAVSRGVDLKTVGDLLGHADLSTTSRYAKPDAKALRRAANKTERLILERAAKGGRGAAL